MISLTPTTASSPMASLSSRLEISEALHRLTFSDSDWNRIVRAGLHSVGEWFIAQRLPLRFGEFARTDLGYDRKQDTSPKALLATALADGTIQKLADQFFGGYNPWRLGKVPGPLWQKWLNEGRKAGRYNISITGTLSTAKRDLRAKVKRDLRAELYAKAGDNPGKFETPLVHSGELRDDATTHSTVTATATASAQKVHISIPDPHGPSHPVVGAVLRRITQPELVEAGLVLGRTVDALINGAATRTVARGVHAGQLRRSLTADQRESIAHTVAAQRGGVAA